MDSSPRSSLLVPVDAVLLRGKLISTPSVVGCDLTDSGAQCPPWLLFELFGYQIISPSHGGPKKAFGS